MADEDPLVNGHPLSSLRVVDLREELERHGLSKTGNKKELADRLREFLTEGAEHEASPVKSIPEVASPTKSPENSLVAAYKARQAAALNKATVEKDRVHRTSESVSPQKDSPTKTVQKEDESDSEPESESKEETRKEEIEKTVDNSQLKLEAKAAGEKHQKAEKKEMPSAETKPETSPPKAPSSAKVSLPHKNSKEDDPTTKPHKERSRTPSPETPEVEPKKSSPSGAPMTAVEAEQEDHVELDYGDGDVDETNVEDEPKKIENEELETPSPVVEAAAEEKPKSQERQKIEAPREKSVEPKKSTSSSSQKTRDISPSRYPESEIVHIRGLMRPFTIPNLKLEICKEGGEIADFWIDNLRSHCFVKMSSVEQAAAIRTVLHNHHWPASNPKKLVVQFDNQETMDRYKSGESQAPASASNSRTISTDSHHEKTESTERKVEKTDRSDRRDRPTLAPLGGRNGLKITLETMVRDNTKKEEEDRERREKDGREKAREIEKKIKEREVKEKEERENRKRHRSITPPHREKQRERHSPDRKERRRNDTSRGDHDEKKTEEAPVKKTADEFFKKTIAQPSIYYLPLTEEEAVARAAKRERERR